MTTSYNFPQWLRDLYTKDLLERIKRHDQLEWMFFKKEIIDDVLKPILPLTESFNFGKPHWFQSVIWSKVKVYKPGTVAIEGYGGEGS